MRSAMRFLLLAVAGWGRGLRGGLLILLCAAVPMYGAAGARMTMLGPAHHHESAAAQGHGLDLDLDLDPDHAHEHRSLAEAWRGLVHDGLQRLAGQGSSQILETARVRQLQRLAVPEHVHTHGVFERHHHLAGDPTVVLDDHATPSGGDAAALGGYALPMLSAAPLRLPVPDAANGDWPRAGAPLWRSAIPPPGEKPPRA